MFCPGQNLGAAHPGSVGASHPARESLVEQPGASRTLHRVAGVSFVGQSVALDEAGMRNDGADEAHSPGSTTAAKLRCDMKH